jgi:multiple sugar transport system substrate-binding protein
MKRFASLIIVLMVISMLLPACAAPATPAAPVVVTAPPQVVTAPPQVVTAVVTVEKTVVAIQTVEKQVEVTSTPAPLACAGVTVNVLTFTGPQIAEPLQRHGPEFEKLSGAKINVVTVPFSDLYQKILTDFATGTNSYQAIVYAPQWVGDFVEPGYLEDLTDRVKNDTALQWDDVAPFFRDFSATYKGKIYNLPLDGDFQMLYYRSDLFAQDGIKPPETWDDYLAAAQHFNGKDLNGDGTPDYGSCISKKRAAQGFQMFWSFAGGFMQALGTSEGAWFDINGFKPLTNNDAMAKALDIYKETTKYGPPEELNMDVGDTRTAFITGRCALSIDWGDIGTLAIDPTQSKVIDKVGSVIIPGTKEILDRATGKLVPCDAKVCPYATNGVNHGPFAAFGGWSGAINAHADPKQKDCAYQFLSYVSQPAQSNVDVTIGKTGFNPYRLSQFRNRDQWIKSGMSDQAAKDYLGAIEASLNSPNMVLDLRIQNNQQYQQVVLDQALSQFLAGELTRDQAMKQITDGWEELTNEIGRDKQLAIYEASLGVTK